MAWNHLSVKSVLSDDALFPRLGASHAPLGLIEVGLIDVSGRAARNSPPTASAVETAATQNKHEDDDDQKGSAIHDRLLADTALRLGMITNPS